MVWVYFSFIWWLCISGGWWFLIVIVMMCVSIEVFIWWVELLYVLRIDLNKLLILLLCKVEIKCIWVKLIKFRWKFSVFFICFFIFWFRLFYLFIIMISERLLLRIKFSSERFWLEIFLCVLIINIIMLVFLMVCNVLIMENFFIVLVILLCLRTLVVLMSIYLCLLCFIGM